MAVNNKDLGARIKKKRTEKHMSQDALGKAVFVNNEHISRIESGKINLSVDLLVLIANALDVSADDLLQDSLLHPGSHANAEIIKLLLDCNHDEKAILTRTLMFLKALLTEFGI